MKELCRIVVVGIFVTALAACGMRTIKPDDNGLPVYRLDDGSLCKAPENFEDLIKQPQTHQMQLLFLSSAAPSEVAAAIVDLPPRPNLDAAFYVACAQYAGGELSNEEFSRQRRIWQEFRLAHLSRGIREWRDDPEGYDEPGKICHFIFRHGLPDDRDVTRLVPMATTVDDCAIYVVRSGGAHVLLGCSNGRWDTQWAQAPLLAGPNGWAVRNRSAAGTHYVPEPNCGWY